MSFIDVRGSLEYLPEDPAMRGAKLLIIVEDHLGKDMADELRPYLDCIGADELSRQLDIAEGRILGLEVEVDSLKDYIDDLREIGYRPMR